MPGFSTLLPFIIQGLAFGAMYAVTGTGVVVLYRTTGVVNLAFGAIGAMGAHLVWSLMGGSLAVPAQRVRQVAPRGDQTVGLPPGAGVAPLPAGGPGGGRGAAGGAGVPQSHREGLTRTGETPTA